jgi:DNA-binding NtrC family response regulator
MAAILLVDDDEAFRRVVHRVLERAGHHVHDACNGVEALRCFALVQYELVITDLIMPDKEGIETIIAMRKMDPAVRIIAMSGGGRVSPTANLQASAGLGAACTLAKPFSREELLKAVDAVLADRENQLAAGTTGPLFGAVES